MFLHEWIRQSSCQLPIMRPVNRAVVAPALSLKGSI